MTAAPILVVKDVDPAVGPARVTLQIVRHPRALLFLGHGAGGSIGAPDLLAVTDVALAAGITVGRVEQPYRVAGKRVAAPAPKLDLAWVAVLDEVRATFHPDLPLYVGGRSSGARVACRTAASLGAAGVICLAFPLHPPGKPEKSRLPELDGVPPTVPVLIVQGERDPFGMPPAALEMRREVVAVPGNHSLRATGPVADAVSTWLSARGQDDSRAR